MAVRTILKQPAEVLREVVRFPALATIQAVSAIIVTARGLVPGALAMDAEGQLLDGAIAVSLAGGSDGERYLVTVRAEDGNGDVAEAELDVLVIDASWAMPDGGTAYLSISEFVARFGLAEVIAATDETGEGRIDKAMLVARLVDAQAVVDAHLAARYVVPLPDVPLIIRKIVGDIAGAALYPRGAPDGIAKQADNSLRMLQRIQSGEMPLPLATPPAQQPATENPILIAPGRRAYPDGLAGF